MTKPANLTLSPQHVSILTLRRQHLAAKSSLPMAVARDLVAIQAQYAATPPLALWARCPQIDLEWVDRSLFEQRNLVKTWCLRGTVHVLASEDLPLMVAAVGPQQTRDFKHFMKTRRGLDGAQLEQINTLILRALAGKPCSRSEIQASAPQLDSLPGISWGLDVKGLAFQGQVIFADPQGGESRFVRRESWLPGLKWNLPDEHTAQAELLRRYLYAYGPATLGDFAHWSGLKMALVRRAFENCQDELFTVFVDGWKGPYYLLRQDQDRLEELDPHLPDVIFLPKYDPLLLAYREKSRFIEAEHLAKVYRPAGQVEAVALVGGQVCATWRINSKGKSLALNLFPFRPLDRREIELLQSAAEQLGIFYKAKELKLAFADS